MGQRTLHQLARTIILTGLVCPFLACATITDSKVTARGDASGTILTCSTATFDSEGVMATCENMVERTAVGGAGSNKLYEMISVVLSGVSILFQVLK